MQFTGAESLLTPALRDVLSRRERARRPPLHTLTILEVRLACEAGSGVLEIPAQVLSRVVNFNIPVRVFAEGFVLDEADLDDWRFSPIRAEHLSDVAAAWLGLVECVPLVDQGLVYAYRLRAGGVPVKLEMYRGVTHEFIKMDRVIPEARHALADAVRALRHAFHLKPLR